MTDVLVKQPDGTFIKKSLQAVKAEIDDTQKQTNPINNKKNDLIINQPQQHLSYLDDLVFELLDQADIEISSELMSRFKNLINSWLKNIRTDWQLLDSLSKAVGKGGLSLSTVEAEELLYILRQLRTKYKSNIKINNQTDEINLKTKENSTKNTLEENNALRIRQLEANHNNLVNDIEKPIKQIKKETVGPIEEMRKFSLDDFRRLGNNNEVRKESLLNKFISWREHSYLFYLKLKFAWLQSPLYNMYIKIIIESFNNEQNLVEYLKDNKTMSLEEFLTINDINKNLV